MAAAIITVSNVIHSYDNYGKHTVDATVDFDTGDSTTNGIPLATTSVVVPGGATVTGLLNALGLKQIDGMLLVASISSSGAYTKALWDTANGTVTYNYFLDTATNGTPKAPLLKIQSAGAQVGTGNAVAATAQFRARFIGT